MDPSRFSTLAHRDHDFCNPVGSEKVDRMLALLELTAGQRVVDIGCGKAELLIRLVERSRVSGVGIDLNPHWLGEGRARAASRVPDGDLTLLQMDVADFMGQEESFDVGVCIGATHAYGSYRKTLKTLPRLVRPGGLVLVGEGYWKRDPDADYLMALGAQREEFTDHKGNIEAGVEEGLTPLYSQVSSEDDWDHYEGLYVRAIERFASSYPDDPDSEEMTARIRRWRTIFHRWGRSTLGFGLYLFQKP